MQVRIKPGVPNPLRTWLGRAPIGVAALAMVLALLGAGLLLGGAYLATVRRELSWIVHASALALGPIVLYFAVQLLRLARWTWLAMILLLVLLAASSAFRASVSGGLPTASVLELVVEAVLLAYLARRPVRRAFGWH